MKSTYHCYQKKLYSLSSVFLILFTLLGLSACDSPGSLINAGEDRRVHVGDPVTFDARLLDPKYSATYTWSEGDTTLFTGKTFTKNDFGVGVHTIILSASLTTQGGDRRSATDTVIITVVEPVVNHRPTATGATITTDYNTPVNITLTGGDIDPQDSITFHLGQLPRHGHLSGNPPNTTYTPNAGYSGEDSFQFYVSDGFLDSTPATVTITVNAKVGNIAPVSNAGSDASTSAGVSYRLDGSKSNDDDGDPITYHWSIVSQPAGSSASFSDATFQRPEFTADKVGHYTLALTVNDGVVSSPADEVVITVISQLFSWCDAEHGKELWQRNGRTPSLLTDIAAGDTSSDPQSFAFFNNKVFFSAFTNDKGTEIWTRDATGATSLFADINKNAGDSFPTQFTVLNDKLFFVADDGINGAELWVTEGDSANPPILLNINEVVNGDRNGSSYPLYLTTANDKLYFKANDGIHGYEFWESDGTVAGTKMVKNIAPNEHHSNIHHIVSTSNGLLFFKATDETTSNPQLWKSTGTLYSTSKIKDMGVDSSLNNLTIVGNRLYFTSDSYAEGENPTGVELWRSDGSSDSTSRVADLYPGATGSSPRELISFNRHLYFIAQQTNDNNDEMTLWRTDGDNEPITLVVHINSPSRLTVVGDSLFYLSNGGANSVKLWRLNAGSSSPSLVKDFNISNDGYPSDFEAVNNTLYLTTHFDNPLAVDHLWIVDEITENSQSITDIKMGCSSRI